jgi:hypothetical protein
MRKAAWILAIVLIGITGALGLYNGPRDLGDGVTPLQKSVSIAVTLYGVFGVTGAIGLARRRRWSVTVIAAWALAVMYAATIASFAFHDPAFSEEGTLAGVIGASVSTAVIGALMIWAARSGTRVPPSTESGHIPRP